MFQMKKLKILIVEDDEISRDLLRIQVRMFAKEVLEVRTGVEAIEICRRNPDIDLVLMDIQLPEMDGFVASQFHPEFKSRPETPHPLFLGLITTAKNKMENLSKVKRLDRAIK